MLIVIRLKLRISEESLLQSRKNSLFFKNFRSAVLERFGKDELEDLFSLSLVQVRQAIALWPCTVFLLLVNLVLKDEKLRSEVLFYQIFAKHSSKKLQHPTSVLKRPHYKWAWRCPQTIVTLSQILSQLVLSSTSLSLNGEIFVCL